MNPTAPVNTNPSSPAISITPSNSNGANVNVFKSRSRAGTLPSSFLNTPSLLLNNNNNLNNSNNLNNNYNNLNNNSLPTMDSISLAVSGSSPSPSSNAIDIPTSSSTATHAGVPTSSRRMRSGSLFSTNSIWNDDNVSVHSSSQHSNGLLDNTSLHSFDGTTNSNINNINNNNNNNIVNSNSNNSSNGSGNTSSFISPNSSLTSSGAHGTTSALNANTRNRSYTTTAAISNINILPMTSSSGFSMADSHNSSRMSTSPFVNVSNKTNDMNYLLDNLMLNMNNGPANANLSNIVSNSRHRAQTYSGTTPTIPESTLNHPQGAQVLQQQQQQQQQQYPQIQLQFPHQLAENVASEQPVLLNDYDFSQLVITTNFENPSLGPTRVLLFDNLPQFVDAFKLYNILSNSLGNQRTLGGVRAIRITSTASSKLALVESSSVDIAMSLKANFNHLELVPGVILYVAFAKIVEPQSTITQHQAAPVVQATAETAAPISSSNGTNGNSKATSTNGVSASKPNGSNESKNTDLIVIQKSLIHTISKLSTKANHADLNKVVSIINKSIAYPNDHYQDNFGPLPDPIPLRQFDSPKLRELRKILENNENALNNEPLTNSSPVSSGDGEEGDVGNKVMTQLELEELCLAMLDELPELCYDYLGNTIVQKLFNLVESPLIKLMMVKEITPFLTQLSIHKNGTWAIQKIINLCGNDFQQKYLIGASLKPYAAKLFNDQFGNYVLQGCIKFGSPFNDFVFEAMLDNFIEISFGRFGARCIRTILETANESNAISNEQVVLVAGLIVEFANELVVNNNGSLLITWFLDTFNDKGAAVDDRFELLTNKFLPHLAKLCTHKLANLTILKILNNRSDLKRKQLIMDTIFGRMEDYEGYSDEIDDSSRPTSKLLELILSEYPENAAGPLFIYKILTNPLLLNLNDVKTGNNEMDPRRNSRYQQFIVGQIRRILLELNITNFQPYKKLMDEAGLSSNRLNRATSMTGNGKRNKRGGNSRSGISSHGVSSKISPESGGIPGQPVMATMSYGAPPQYYIPAQQYQQQKPLPQGSPKGYNAYQNMPPMMNQQQYPISQQPLYYQPEQQMHELQQQQDILAMQQLEQLSLSSAALGYNSNPGTPGGNNQRSSFF
ncbi:RNA-binding protein [Scheffersomyces stipitis CBS 6054]|uniref:RNA-binding protein n=1 Tax=Scheffersomyces stipitis (strain ATCC 58785 / CBS 6054 / NBRC 10063 / NRRL Y-11545) TaxID=322104 RepID=A3LVS7_PICST|nr:RNA-binding protein [Scheffersomyces stipitis CBS 6054]ABN66831.2 RNA-binding protein [Scheffersomyces stipitis CBS 6054]